MEEWEDGKAVCVCVCAVCVEVCGGVWRCVRATACPPTFADAAKLLMGMRHCDLMGMRHCDPTRTFVNQEHRDPPAPRAANRRQKWCGWPRQQQSTRNNDAEARCANKPFRALKGDNKLGFNFQ